MNSRKIFNNNIIIWLIIIFFFIIVVYNYKRNAILYEGLEASTPENRLEANRFKIENTEFIIQGPNALGQLQQATQTSQKIVDDYMGTKDYAPVNNDADVKTAISILYNDINQFTTTYSKLYFIASTVPIFFSPFVYDKTKLASQYNALLLCYPNTIKDGTDYSAMYTIIILSQIANDIINSELNPKVKTITGLKEQNTNATLAPRLGTDYYGYITDPILKEINVQLNYFNNKFGM